MVTDESLPVEDRISQLLQHLGVKQAHFAARVPSDWQGLVQKYPESVASLTLLCPRPSNLKPLAVLGPRVMVVTGDKGTDAETLKRSLEEIPEARLVALRDYSPSSASDIGAEQTDAIGTAMLDFLQSINREEQPQRVSSPASAQGSSHDVEGEVAGILYRIQGSGPPLVLCPLQYSPSQWDPLLPRLSQKYSTISVGGPYLAAVGSLEKRARGGYLAAVQRVVEEARLKPGERVLDVGCGPGSLDRWLARYTGGANPITGIDPSTYLVREARAMVKGEGLEETVDFHEGSGDSLPFPDGAFDVAMSFTAMQYVDADQMIREMMRVIKPGGRVAVLARGDDRPNLINVSLPPDLKSKVEGQRNERPNELGCNDSSLYRRFHRAGLTDVKMFPQLAIYTPATDGERLKDAEGRILPVLSPEEAEEFHSAVAQARADGSYFVAEWFHCAVGARR